MAADWLKITKDTPDKPEVMQIASMLNCHPDSAFAGCFRLWSWFDAHTTNGVTHGVTKVTLDALLHRDGLCDAMSQVGWLLLHPDGRIEIPNFDYHNSETAKSRALSAKRQDKHRLKIASNRDKSNALSVTPCVTREEKRREEVNPTIKRRDDGKIGNPDSGVGVFTDLEEVFNG